MKTFVSVALTDAAREVDQIFTYTIDAEITDSIELGMKVLVPFGKGNRMMEAIVMGFPESCAFKVVKDIAHVLYDDIRLDSKQVQLVQWLRKRYLCTYSEALQTLMPSGTSLKRTVAYKVTSKGLEEGHGEAFEKMKVLFNASHLLKKEDLEDVSDYRIKKLVDQGWIERDDIFESSVSDQVKKKYVLLVEISKALAAIPSRNAAQVRILKYLAQNSGTAFQADIIKRCRASVQALQKLEKMKFIRSENATMRRTPQHYRRQENSNVKLNMAQQAAYESIRSTFGEDSQVHLIHGVTGSGKTEIYLQLAQDVLEAGKQCLVLVPEISLTPQIISKFVHRFGDKVAVFHSKLSMGERFDQWKAVKRGELNIIIGARSALFAPCTELGLIILDEEHDNAYKSDQNPKYSAVETAKFLGKQHGVPVVLGSATPSLLSMEKVKQGDYAFVELKERFNDQSLPEVEIVDMREELAMGNKSIFSEALFHAIEDRLLKSEQVILFLNRKGHSTFVSCRSCGYSLKCPECEIALTYHKSQNRATCHYCGYSLKVPTTCPSCSSGYFKFFGTGTEKVEEMTRKSFPKARVDRLDRQSVSRKGQMEAILDRFEREETDILIGTQMVTKGLDFKGVTLVGVLSADVLLNLPDFQSGERTFQILTQVAGRAGRGETPGEVIIQTYTPEHYAVQAASGHDYESFLQSEDILRKTYKYPPYMRLSNILISGTFEKHVIDSAKQLYEPIQAEFIKNRLKKVQILGPNPAIYSKIKGRYRWQILVKSEYSDGDLVGDILRRICLENRDQYLTGETRVSVDFDAVNIL